MGSYLGFLYRRFSEKLWVRPLLFSLLAVTLAMVAALADSLSLDELVPRVDRDIVEKLLSIIAASMLGVATFAVGSMVSAYASVSSSATPRAFTLVVSDDVSKTALSTFVAAFIFSVIALVAIKSDAYGRVGVFLLFVMTLAVLGWVVLTFIRWVDQIARLGRVGTTIDRVENAAVSAIKKRRRAPHMSALPYDEGRDGGDAGEPLYGKAIGYVQHINVGALQACAEKYDLFVTVSALPGAFVAPGRALARIRSHTGGRGRGDPPDLATLEKAFIVGHDRTFDEDPRFGLIALSEIAARALSPAVNDPGTAIDIIGTLVRLFVLWIEPEKRADEQEDVKYDRVRIPSLALGEMFDDAFTAIARDGAGTIEVIVRLQKAFISLSTIPHADLADAVRRHSKLSLARAELALTLATDVERVRSLASKVA